MKNPVKLKELIMEKVRLSELMLAYKVSFVYDPRQATEVQFRCPFHGKDQKPSARLYNGTNSCYCWVCRKAWDPVSFIMDMEKMPFLQAIKYLINRFSVDTSSVLDEPELTLPAGEKLTETDFLLYYLRGSILGFRKNIPFDKYRALCSAYLMLEWSKTQGVDIVEGLHKIQDKITCLKK